MPFARRRHHSSLFLAAAALGFLLSPRPVQAQRPQFIQHLVQFRLLLSGVYGDEGPDVVATLEQLSNSLRVWEAESQAEQARLRGRLTGVPANDGDARLALATLLASRGRMRDALTEVEAANGGGRPDGRIGLLRGRLLDALGRHPEAMAAYRDAYQAAPTDSVAAYLAFDPNAASDTPDVLSAALTSLLDAHRRERGVHGTATVPSVFDMSLVPDAASSSPLFAPAAYAAGFAAMTAGDYRDGLARFRAAVMQDPLVVDPASQSSAMRAAIDDVRAGRMADAVAPLEAVVAAHPKSSEGHRLLGTVAGALGRTEAALEHLRRAVNLAPADERSRLALSQVLLRAGSAGDAIRELRSTVGAMPESGECWFLLAQALETAGQPGDAATAFETARDTTLVAGRSALALQAAGIADLHQDLDRSFAWLRWRVGAAPNDAAVHRDLGIPLARRGRREEALAEMAMADLLGGAGAEGLTVFGQTLMAIDRLADAETVLRRAVALEPDRQDTRYALGRTLLRQGHAAEAREQLDLFQQIRRRTMEQQRQVFEIDKLRAEAAREAAAGHVERLAAIWRDIAERRPDVLEFQLAAGDALAVLGDAEGATTYFTRAARLGGGAAVDTRLAALHARTSRP